MPDPGRRSVLARCNPRPSTAGPLVSGLLAGVWPEVFGYRTTFGLCALTAVLAAVAFGSRSRR
ncbi:hypothetical protein GCM10022223_53050 [Kineosporia mesophila]|uniref:Major facilitator superfamily (MFS) profile domain-containing protein n=1 Tax=Kineosporia mesophila TaxID=566012 RepID=A0ABP7ABQ8_9ACTN|nr:hypothetical protein [Kineosporia mesophila]MCD5351312.1 hypothetical protein [Kineosporia mesophila]